MSGAESMNPESALNELQLMHQNQTITNNSIIAWYTIYQRKLPKLCPSESDIDMVRTIALWMELTDRGGQPAFPYEYASEIILPTIDVNREPRLSLSCLGAAAVFVVGIIVLVFMRMIGVILIVVSAALCVVGYVSSGSSGNPDLLTTGSSMYRREGKRVLDWMQASKRGDVRSD